MQRTAVFVGSNLRVGLFGLGKSANTFYYDRAKDHYSPAPHDPALERLGIAYFQTAYELFESGHYRPSPPDGRVADAAGAK